MPSLLLVLYLLMLTLNLLDGISTWIFVHPQHYEREANPVARWMFRKLGITAGIILAEVLWIGFFSLLFFLLVYRTMWQLPLTILFGFGVAIFASIVPGNISYCLRLRKKAQRKKQEEQNAQ